MPVDHVLKTQTHCASPSVDDYWWFRAYVTDETWHVHKGYYARPKINLHTNGDVMSLLFATLRSLSACAAAFRDYVY